MGFSVVPEDTCVFVRRTASDLTIVCLYVDDGLVCGTKALDISLFISKLRSEFEITDSEPSTYVGMEIKSNRADKTISISQRGYVSRVLERFGMSEAKPLLTPFDSAVVLDDTQVEGEQRYPYREAIGSLNFASLISRPDITFAVNTLARYCNNPQPVHWKAVKRVMAYLRGTIDYTITYSGSDNTLIGYCASDWAGEKAERRSTSAFVFTLNNAPIAWSSRLQKVSALSVTEAEYISLAGALTQCLWLRPFLSSLGFEMTSPTPLRMDNQSAIAVSKNPELHKNMKHVGTRYHRVRQEQEAGVVRVEYIATELNPADFLTKGVTSMTLKHGLRLINVQQ